MAATVNPGMAWTTMTQALTPQVVPSWRYVYPLVRFFQKRGDPAKAASVCVELAWTASPAAISGRYITEHGKPGRYPRRRRPRRTRPGGQHGRGPGAARAHSRRPHGAAMTMAMLIGAALACFAANLCVLDWRRNG